MAALAIALALLKAGAKLNAKSILGWAPLHYAALTGHSEVARILLKAGANVNAENNGGKTPLNMIRYGRPFGDAKKLDECAKLLRKHGAKTDAELDAGAKQGKE